VRIAVGLLTVFLAFQQKSFFGTCHY